MSLLSGLLERAKNLLSSKPAGSAVDAVPAGELDRMIYDDLLEEAPALRSLVEELNEEHPHTHDLVRDVLMSFYQDRLQVRDKGEMDPTRLHNWSVASGIQQVPETQTTREHTVHSKYGSAIATIGAGDAVRELLSNTDLSEEAEEAEEKQQALDQALKGLQEAVNAAANNPDDEGAQTGLSMACGAAEAAQQAAEAAQQALEAGARQAQLKMQGALQDAVKAAGDELREEEELFRAWGVADGEPEQWSFEERQRNVERFRKSAVTDHSKLFGAFRYAEKAVRAKRVKPGRDEVYGITLSGRVNDALPRELANLKGPRLLRLDFLDRLSAGQILTREYRGEEKSGMGAIVMIVDTSDSMNWKRGNYELTPAVWSKALMLALLQRARVDRRDFVGIIFSSRNQVEVYRFPKGQGPIDQVVEMVSKAFNGGTDFESPLNAAMDILDEEFVRDGACRGDVVFVTDDDCAVSDEWFAAYQERKATLGFRTWGIAVPKKRPGGTLAKLSDNARGIDTFDSAEPVLDLLKAV